MNDTDLVDAGWPEDPDVLRALHEAVAELEARGISDRAYILKLLSRRFPKPDLRLRQRPEGREFAEAIEAVTPEDAKNLAKVRRFMGELMRCPVIEAGAIMPDACPAGQAEASIPVGGVVAARNSILPGAHGHDICCSLYATVFQAEAPSSDLMDRLVASTRFGPGGRAPGDRVHHPVLEESVWTNPFLKGLEEHARSQMADQGDGNHFAYLGRMTFSPGMFEALRQGGQGNLAEAFETEARSGRTDALVLVTHHGSRGLGAQLFQRGMEAAIRQTAKMAQGIPEAASWLDAGSVEGKKYWEALQYVGRWTLANHQSIHARFLEAASARAVAAFGNEHNFVWRRGDLYLHGKGATPAWSSASGAPLPGLIPLNMAEPILMVLGGDNADYLHFAPHGAGRNESRRALLRRFRLPGGGLDLPGMEARLAQSTEGIDVRWYLGKPDLSESPMAYKPAAEVRRQLEAFRLARVVAEIEPLGSVMAGNAPRREEQEVLTPKQRRQQEHRAGRRKLRQQLRDGEWSEGEA